MRRVTRRPTIESLQYFHVDPKGHIHFERNPIGGSSIEVGRQVRVPVAAGGYTGSFPVSILERVKHWLPELREQFFDQLREDSYAGIHTVYRPKTFPGTDDFRRINAAQLDLDFGDSLDYFDAVSRLSELTGKGILPPFSLIVNTGHGAHVFWLLRGDEEDPELPPRSKSRNRRRAIQVNGALVQLVKDHYPELQPDDHFVHITTHTRVEGSVNTRTGLEVAYTVNYTPEGPPPRYTLWGLADWFGCPTMRDTYRRTRTTTEKTTPKRRSGWVARFENPLQDFQIVRAYMEAHGGFPQGTRRHAVLFVATLMRPCGYKTGEIEAEAMAVAKRCNPPLPEHEVRAQVKSALKKQRQPRNTTIAAKLGVDLEIANELELVSIRPDFVAEKPLKGRTAKQEARHTFLKELAGEHGNPLPFTFSDLQVKLKAAGHGSVRGTVVNDLKKLGFDVQGSTKRRADDTTTQTTLPE